MTRRFAAAIALLALFACAFCSRNVNAATPLPPAPVTGYCYDSFVAPNYNGVRACQVIPPPPIDPGAYTTLAVTWLNHGDRNAHAIDVTACENLLGRIGFSYPVTGWSYANGSTVQWSKTSAKYLRCRVRMPLNAGVVAHPIRVVGSYGSTVPVRMALVAQGMPWPTGAANGCWIPSGDSERFALYINPGPTTNPTRCGVALGGTADLLVDSATGAFGKIAITAN